MKIKQYNISGKGNMKYDVIICIMKVNLYYFLKLLDSDLAQHC